MSMADKMVLMNEGEIIQQGKPKILYEKPDNTFTAKFLGNPPMNLINLEVEKNGNYIPISGEKIFVNKKSNKKKILGIRPENIKISKEGIKCTINDLDYQGSDVVLSLQLGNQEIFARIDSKKVEELDNQVYINWDNNNLHLFDFESGVRDVN
jgi:ABC-type sugar transport system ATPase subunit